MSILLKQEIKYYIINTEVTNNLSLKKRIPCIQYVKIFFLFNIYYYNQKFVYAFILSLKNFFLFLK